MAETMNTLRSPGGQILDLPLNLPGSDLVAAGIAALESGEQTVEAALVALGAPRLRAIGLDIPTSADAIAEPNLALYSAVCEAGGDHFRYNALLASLLSFSQAAEWAQRKAHPNSQTE